VSLEQQRIEQLEGQIKELHEVLWKHVEAMTASTNLIIEMSKHRKPGTQEKDSEHLELLIQCRNTLLTQQELLAQKAVIFTFGTLMDDLRRSIGRWEKRVEQ
jgi:hypothetical protein